MKIISSNLSEVNNKALTIEKTISSLNSKVEELKVNVDSNKTIYQDQGVFQLK